MTRILFGTELIHDMTPKCGVLVQASDAEVCSICFEQACSIEVRECGHQMCSACTLALCCHAKPNPATQSQPQPTCPFCRGGIARLVVATRTRAGDDDDEELAAACWPPP